MRGIQDDQPRAIINHRGEFVHIEGEVTVFTKLDGYRPATDVVDHRLVNGKSGIGINDLISLIDKRQNCEEYNGLAPGYDYYLVARHFHAAGPAHILRNGLPQLRLPRRRSIMRPTFTERGHAGLHDIRGGIEVGLSDFQMDDASALALEGSGFVQNFEGRLSAKAGHAAGKLQFVCGGSLHIGSSGRERPLKRQTADYTPRHPRCL